MGYYTGGDYYMAGGFLKKLRKVGKKALRGATKLSKFAGKAAPLVSIVNPALGMGMASVAQSVGRVSQMFSTPAAAPAGVPMEGAPPFAPYFSAGSMGGAQDPYLFLLLQLMARSR